MEGIRTVTVTLPRFLSEIVASLVRDRVELEVVADLRHRSEVVRRIPALAPALILIGLRVGESDAVAATALELAPNATVVALACDRRTVYVHKPHGRRAALLDASSAALVDVIVASRQPALGSRA